VRVGQFAKTLRAHAQRRGESSELNTNVRPRRRAAGARKPFLSDPGATPTFHVGPAAIHKLSPRTSVLIVISAGGVSLRSTSWAATVVVSGTRFVPQSR
jgi:hypothetical protein